MLEKIDLTQLIFELIVLNIPKKRKHPLNKEGNSTCNKEMIELVGELIQGAEINYTKLLI